jgi:hypothetical protein
MKYYLILTAIFMVQISACSIMNKKVQKSNESVSKKQIVTKDSTGYSSIDSFFKKTKQLNNATYSVATNDIRTDENIIEWIQIGQDSAGLSGITGGGNILKWDGSMIKGPVMIRKTNRITYDKGGIVSSGNIQMSKLDSGSKLTKSGTSFNQVNQSDSTGTKQTVFKDIAKKVLFPGWWIVLILVAVAYFARRYWLPEVARLFS